MKNMLKVVEEFLKKNEKGATFNEIFDHVREEMKQTWKELFPTKLLKNIEDDKIGELYTLMSIDGRFVRNNEQKWFSIETLTFDEVKQMRINASEAEELDQADKE